jgi:hypothetical protein
MCESIFHYLPLAWELKKKKEQKTSFCSTPIMFPIVTFRTNTYSWNWVTEKATSLSAAQVFHNI